MHFYLVYKGPLSATQGKKRGKKRCERIEIRKQIAPQMKRLWETSSALVKLQWDARVPGKDTHVLGSGDSPLYPHYESAPAYPMPPGYVDLSGGIERFGKSFRPLIRKSLDLTCSLDILFLRQEDPGSLRKEAGDLDNRIKTFIDALEMPAEQLEGDESEDVNYPLLEDDTLVRGLNIVTERLLLPEKDYPNQVHLIVNVKLHVEKVGPWNMCLL